MSHRKRVELQKENVRNTIKTLDKIRDGWKLTLVTKEVLNKTKKFTDISKIVKIYTEYTLLELTTKNSTPIQICGTKSEMVPLKHILKVGSLNKIMITKTQISKVYTKAKKRF